MVERLSDPWGTTARRHRAGDVPGGCRLEKLLHDEDEKVRMEAPEIFRVLGKRRPEFVRPYMEQLRQISETDSNRVVRIHCLGAIKATLSKQTMDMRR